MNAIDITSVDLNLLKVFEALYEEGGASRAAIRVNLTQSAVSAALRRLRALYSDPLFTRTGRGLSPTSRACEIKPVIVEALDKCRQSLSMTYPDTGNFHGRSVSIGLSDDFELSLGRRIMNLVAIHAPGLRVIFRQTHSQIVSDALANRDIDLAIASGGFGSRGLKRQILGEGDYACLLDQQIDLLNLDDYVERDHILISSGGVIGVADEALALLGRKRRIVASVTHFSAVPHLLKGSNAIATLPTHAARAIATLTGLHVKPCPLPLGRYPIELGWRAGALRDSAIAKVHAIIVDCSAPMDAVASTNC